MNHWRRERILKLVCASFNVERQPIVGHFCSVTCYRAHTPIYYGHCSTNRLLTVCTDWRSNGEPPTKKQKLNEAGNEEKRAETYKKLKESIPGKDTDCTAAAEQSEEPTCEQLQTKEAVECQMTQVVSAIKFNARRQTHYYAILGFVLANLKYLHIDRKCDSCQQATDIYDVLKCGVCSDGKKNPTNGFYGLVEDKTSYKRNFTDFLINFGKLCKQYPKLAKCHMSTHDIKNKITMTFLSEKMAEDEQFWSS